MASATQLSKPKLHVNENCHWLFLLKVYVNMKKGGRLEVPEQAKSETSRAEG